MYLNNTILRKGTNFILKNIIGGTTIGNSIFEKDSSNPPTTEEIGKLKILLIVCTILIIIFMFAAYRIEVRTAKKKIEKYLRY